MDIGISNPQNEPVKWLDSALTWRAVWMRDVADYVLEITARWPDEPLRSQRNVRVNLDTYQGHTPSSVRAATEVALGGSSSHAFGISLCAHFIPFVSANLA